MKSAQLKLRQKLLLLLVAVGGGGIAALLLIVTLADRQLFGQFLPENRAMRDIEARSALLVQNYYRFMLTPDHITVGELTGSTVLIRQKLGEYRQLIKGQTEKEQLVTEIGGAVNRLEEAGSDLIVARLRFNRINQLQENLEDEISRVFTRYKNDVGADMTKSLSSANWDSVENRYLPELRMIETVHQLYLRLFLEIRESQAGSEPGNEAEIDGLIGRIRSSSTLLEIIEENASGRAWLATNVLVIYDKMQDIVSQYRDSKISAEFALSQAEQAGIDLNHAVGSAIAQAETIGWDNLRRSLLLSGAILVVTLLVSYLMIYAGLDRILRPLEKLQVVITRLGKGDFKQRSVDIIRTDEIGQLAAAFNRMADQLEENNEQKQQFIEQLEQKNAELERFTYTVSHELKSPLVTVKGFLGLLQKDLSAADQDRIDDDMAKISSAVDTMSRQLEDLLELSRVGRQRSQAETFALSGLCRDVAQLMRGMIDDRAAEVVIQPDMPQVHADRARIGEVIKNLVENGIKFAPPEQRPRIEISAEASAGRILCRVEDNGPGIEPRYQDRVFGLFDRLETGVPGTGVGLALVKRIVEIHDGWIWIESQGDGQGCSFCFTLPAHGGN